MTLRPKLLIIPHLFTNQIKVRSFEFAKRLTPYFNVYFWRLEDLSLIDHPSFLRRRIEQLKLTCGSFLQRIRIDAPDSEVAYVHASFLSPSLLSKVFGFRRGTQLSRIYNTLSLQRVLCQLRPDIVWLASMSFYVPRVSTPFFFDFVDWFPEDCSQRMEDVKDYIKHLKARVKAAFAPSDLLAAKITNEYGIPVIPLHNGADVKTLRQVDPQQVQSVRRRWGLEGKFVIGYIGNHGSFAGIDFLIKVFRELRKGMPDSCLFIVGPIDYWRSFLLSAQVEGIIATGPIEPEQVSAYFNAIDLGVIAFERNPGTNFIFPLKLVEYTACRKFVVSTPLPQIAHLHWPNILLAERNVEEWVRAIFKARTLHWESAWDSLAEPYDWHQLAAQLASHFMRTLV